MTTIFSLNKLKGMNTFDKKFFASGMKQYTFETDPCIRVCNVFGEFDR